MVSTFVYIRQDSISTSTTEESIAKALEKVISNPEYRSELISRGYERVKYFTRARTVAQTMKVYQHVLSVENDSYAR